MSHGAKEPGNALVLIDVQSGLEMAPDGGGEFGSLANARHVELAAVLGESRRLRERRK